MMTHEFLWLSLLLVVPGAIAYLGRPDLRPVIRFVVPLSVPFALTEPLFYPEYWRPSFLFDLADRIGFGIEDVLFVAALGALTVVSYPIVALRTLAPLPGVPRDLRSIAQRGAPIALATAATLAAFAALGVPMIFGCIAAMTAGLVPPVAARRELLEVGVVGALATGLAYFAVCLGLGILVPGVFETVWRTHDLTGAFVLGVPLEELLYGSAAGLAGAIVVPYLRGERFVRAARASS